VTEAVNERFRDIRARRADLAADPGHLRDVLHNGNQRAHQIAEQTLTDVKRLMHTDYAQPA
jgi:tryptophanyl-tRNA synthetase